MMVKRLPEPAPQDATVTVQIRAPTSIGAPLIAVVNIALDATLADLRAQLVHAHVNSHRDPSARRATAPPPLLDRTVSTVAGMGDTVAAVADVAPYPLDLSTPFRFVRRGGRAAIRLSAEATVKVGAALPVVPPYGPPESTYAPRFQYQPAAGTVVLTKPSMRVASPATQWRSVVRKPGEGADAKSGSANRNEGSCEAVLVIYVAGETAPGFPAGTDVVMASRLSLHLDSYGRMPTPKQLAAALNRKNANVSDLLGRSVLHDAVVAGNMSAVAFLLSLTFVDYKAVDGRGESALLLACRGGHIDVVAALLEAGADPLAAAPPLAPNPGETPLHVALRGRYDAVVDVICRKLRQRRVSSNELAAARDAYNETPLTLFATLSPPLEQLVGEGNVAAAQALRQHMLHTKADVTARGPNEETLLHVAARSGSAVMVGFVLELFAAEGGEAAMLSHAKDRDGNTALHAAAADGEVEVAMRLLQAGLTVAETNKVGRTPLHEAAYRHHWDCVSSLITAPSAAAALACLDMMGFTPLHAAASAAPPALIRAVATAGPGAISARAVLERTFRASYGDSRGAGGTNTARPSKPSELHRYLRRIRAGYTRPSQIRKRARSTTGTRITRDMVSARVVGPSPLWCAVHSATGLAAPNERATAAVHTLLAAGAGRSKGDAPGTLLSLVGHAVLVGCYEAASAVLKLVPQDAAAIDRVVLSRFVKLRDAAKVRWLVEHGVGINPAPDVLAASTFGPLDALMLCCESGDANMLQFLLQSARLLPTPEALVRAAALNHTAVVKELLRTGLRPNGVAGRDTPLATAAAKGHDGLVASLLGFGASPGATDARGVSALRLALNAPTAFTVKDPTPFDRCAVALVKAGAPLVSEAGVNHPFNLLTLALSNRLSRAANAIVDELIGVAPADFAALTRNAPQPEGRPFRLVTPAVGAVSKHSSRKAKAAAKTRAPFKQYLPVSTGQDGNSDPAVPRYAAECRTAYSYAAAAGGASDDLLSRLAFDVRLPPARVDVFAWEFNGDRRGMSPADHALDAGSATALLTCLAIGILPLRTHPHVVANADLGHLQAAAHAARLAVTRDAKAAGLVAATADVPAQAAANAAAFVRALLSYRHGPLVASVTRQLEMFIELVRRAMSTSAYEQWCFSGPIHDAIEAGAEPIFSLLAARCPTWPNDAVAGSLLAAAALSRVRAPRAADLILDAVVRRWPRHGSSILHTERATIVTPTPEPTAKPPAPLLQSRDALTPAEWAAVKKRVAGDSLSGVESRSGIPLAALLAAIGETAPLAALLSLCTIPAGPYADACFTAAAHNRKHKDTASRVAAIELLLANGVRPSSPACIATLIRFGAAVGAAAKWIQALRSGQPVNPEAMSEAILVPQKVDSETTLLLELAGAPFELFVPLVLAAGIPQLHALFQSPDTSHVAIDRALQRGAFENGVLLLALGAAPSRRCTFTSRAIVLALDRRRPAAERLASCRMHPRTSKSRSVAGRIADQQQKPTRGNKNNTAPRLTATLPLNEILCRLTLRYAGLGDATLNAAERWPVAHVAAALGNTSFLEAVAAVARHPAVPAELAARVDKLLGGPGAAGGAPPPSLLLASLASGAGIATTTSALATLTNIDPGYLFPDSTAVNAAALVAALAGAPSTRHRAASLQAALRWGVHAQALGAGVGVRRLRSGHASAGGTLAELGPAASASLTTLRTLRLGAGRAVRVHVVSALGVATALGDLEAVKVLLGNGASPRCCETVISRGDPDDPAATEEVPLVHASVLSIAVDRLVSAKGPTNVATSLAIVDALIDAGALRDDVPDASAVAIVAIRLQQWALLERVTEAAADAAMRAAPGEVAAKARRCLRSVAPGSLPLLLADRLGGARHPMHAATASHTLSRDGLIALARHCKRGDVESAVDARGLTAMFFAATNSKTVAVLEVMLSVGFSATAVCDTERKLTPLMAAARHGLLIHATRLLAALETTAGGPAGGDYATAKEHVDLTDARGRTAVLHAASRGHSEIVELLLGVGADRHIVSSDGYTAVLAAIEAGKADVALALVKHWATAADLITEATTALHAAARSGLADVAVHLLSQPALDPVATVTGTADRVSGHTPLFLARAFGHPQVLRAMLAAVAQRDEELLAVSDVSGDGGLDYAEDAADVVRSTSSNVCYGWLRAAVGLAASIAQRVNSSNNRSGTVSSSRNQLRPGEALIASCSAAGRFLRPWHETRWDDIPAHFDAPCAKNLLRWAAHMGCLVVIRALSDQNVLDDCHALHTAAAAGHVEACRLLLALRLSDITAADESGRTAVHAAVDAGQAAAAAYLLQQWPLPHHATLLLFGAEAARKDAAAATETAEDAPSSVLEQWRLPAYKHVGDAARTNDDEKKKRVRSNGADSTSLLHSAARWPAVAAVVVDALSSALPDPSRLLPAEADPTTTAATASDEGGSMLVATHDALDHAKLHDLRRGAEPLALAVNANPLRAALLSRDSTGMTPFEVALQWGCPSAALRIAVALHGRGRPGPIGLPVPRSQLEQLPPLSPAVRCLLFDVFRVPDALTGHAAPQPGDAERSPTQRKRKSSSDPNVFVGETDGDDADGSEASSEGVLPMPLCFAPSRLGPCDIRAAGLAALERDPATGATLRKALTIDHERSFAFRELVRLLDLPLRVSFRFDSIGSLPEDEQLFIVRRLTTSGLLGRYADALRDLPQGSVQAATLEYVPRGADAGVVVRGGEVAERFSWEDDVVVGGSLHEALERAFGVEARNLRKGLSQAETVATQRLRKAFAAHPLFRHVRVAADTGKYLERGDHFARAAVVAASERALDAVVAGMEAAVGEVLAGLTQAQIAAVAKAAAGGATPDVTLVYAPDGAADSHRFEPPEPGALLLTLPYSARPLPTSWVTAQCEAAFGPIARADAALARVHLIRDAFVRVLMPRSVCPPDPANAPPVKVKLELEGADISELPPRALADTLRAVAAAARIVTAPLYEDSNAPVTSAITSLRDVTASRRIAKNVLDTLRAISVLFSTTRRPSVRRQADRLLISFDVDGGPHREDIAAELFKAAAEVELVKLQDAVPSIAADAAQRLHTYLPHATLNVDLQSLNTAFPNDPASQLTALGVLAYKRSALVLLPLVQALGIGWDGRLGAAIRAKVRTVHVTLTTTAPSSLDFLPGGNVVYTVNATTPVPVNGGAVPVRNLAMSQPALGVGLLGAQALASRVVMAVVTDPATTVDTAAAFACWSRLLCRFRTLAPLRPGSKLIVAVEPRNVFNQPTPPEASPEPFQVRVRVGTSDAAAAGACGEGALVLATAGGDGGRSRGVRRVGSVLVPVELVPVLDPTRKRWEYRASVCLPDAATGAVVITGSLHSQPLLRSPLRITIAPGQIDLTKTVVTATFDTLVVGIPATLTITLRDAAGNEVLEPAAQLTTQVAVEGGSSGDVALIAHRAVGGGGRIEVTVEGRRSAIATAVMIRLVDRVGRCLPQPFAVPVDVLSPQQYNDYRMWAEGRAKDETAKRRADRIARYHRQATRDALAKKLQADAEALGAVARAGRRFPKAYPRYAADGSTAPAAAPAATKAQR
jgi:ankyrin repeat protein